MRIALALIALSGILTTASARAETKIAVLPIEDQGVGEKAALLLTEVITTEASKRADLRVIGSADIKSMVTLEQQKSMLACADDSCLAEIGAALGVDAMVRGSAGQLGDGVREPLTTIINLSLVDVRQAKVLARVSEQVPGGTQSLLQIIPYVVGTLMQGIPGGPPPPPRPNVAAAATAGGSAQQAAADDEGGGSSSLPRRIAGIGVAGVGTVLLGAAVLLGVSSLLAFVGTRSPAFPTAAMFSGEPVMRNMGFAPAAIADLGGILAVVIIVTGIAVAAVP